MGFFARVVNGINHISSQVYAVCLIIAGAWLEIKGKSLGHAFVGAGLALLQATPHTVPPKVDINQPQVKVTNEIV